PQFGQPIKTVDQQLDLLWRRRCLRGDFQLLDNSGHLPAALLGAFDADLRQNFENLLSHLSVFGNLPEIFGGLLPIRAKLAESIEQWLSRLLGSFWIIHRSK